MCSHVRAEVTLHSCAPKVLPLSNLIHGANPLYSLPRKAWLREAMDAPDAVMASGLSVPYGPRRRPWRETVSDVAVSHGTLLVTPPSFDPLTKWPENFREGITQSFYQVPSSGLSVEERGRALKETTKTLQKCAENMFGYMCSFNFECPPEMASPLTCTPTVVAGDPFNEKPYIIKPKWVERNVLDYFASLWNAKWPHDLNDPESYWGYVLTMGSSEGIQHALWSARKYLTSGLPSSDTSAQPVLFFSQSANFSMGKMADIVNLKQFHEVGRELYPDQNPLGGDWVKGVPCTGGDAGPGTIDIDALEKLVDFFSARGHPIVVLFNYGTSVKGACDDIKTAGERLVNVLKKNDMYERTLQDPSDPSKNVVRKQFWFHVDGALSAAYMPFLEMAYKNGLTEVEPASVFDFRLDFVSSIVTSGHKYIGTPWPCGVYLTRTKLLPSEGAHHFIGSTDTTVSLSRNTHSLVLLWSFISSNSFDKQVADIVQCLNLVQYALSKLKELEVRLGMDLMIMNTPPSLSILFRKPNARIIFKYSLTFASLVIDSEKVDIAQIYIMKHITTDKIDGFVQELESPDAFIL